MKRIWEGTAFGCQVSIELDAGKLRVFRIDGAPHEIPSYADVIIRHAFVGMAQEIEALRRTPKDEKTKRLKDAIRRYTVEDPSGGPNGPTEAAFEALGITLEKLDARHSSVRRVYDEFAKLGIAMVADCRELRQAADEYFGENFLTPAKDDNEATVDVGARVQTVDADDVCVTLCSTCSRSIVGIDQGLAACPWCERDALRDRLAKLVVVVERRRSLPLPDRSR